MLESHEDRGNAHHSDNSILPDNFPENLPQLLRVQVGRDASTGETVMYDNIVRFISKSRSTLNPSPSVLDVSSSRFRHAEEITCS